jgi:hypothetical protein
MNMLPVPPPAAAREGAAGSAAIVDFGVFVALWPIVAVHACYAISVAQGFVELCNPYWDGCSSISRAGRHGWAHHLFKATMLPYAGWLAIYWWICHRWLAAHGRGSPALLVAGWVGVTFLVLYATFLGIEGRPYQLMRRYGINVYFGATWVAQAILWVRLVRMPAAARGGLPCALAPTLAALSLAVLVLGIAFFAAGIAWPLDRDRWENALEWILSLLMQLAILLTALGWRSARLRLAGSA